MYNEKIIKTLNETAINLQKQIEELQKQINKEEENIKDRKEITEYLKHNGYLECDKWLFDIERKEQTKEAIKNNYNIVDFDRWQHFQDILFGNDYQELDWETSQKIIELLYEKNIEILDLNSYKENN